MLGEFWSRVRFLFVGKRREEVDEEIRFHIERQIEANLAEGMSPEEAGRQAFIAFGGRERAREQCREERPSWGLELLARDLRFAMRGLLRNRGLTTVAVLTLTLAIAANSSIFSLLNQALLRALPVRDPNQLVVFSFAGDTDGHSHSEGGSTPGHRYEFSYPMYRDLRARKDVFSGLIASATAAGGISWDDHSQAIRVEMVSGNYFEVLGVRPALGRLLNAGDETAEGANPVAVLSFNFWKMHLAEAQVVGHTILINGTQFTIVGVVSPAFQSVEWGRGSALFVPVTMQRVLQPEWAALSDRRTYWLQIVGRLRQGVTAVQASAAMNPLFHSLRTQEFTALPDQSANRRHDFVDRSHLNIEGGARGFSPLRDEVRTPLIIIMGMVVLVIAMAVVNVASLLLVRAANRVREFSVRYALGASAPQIVRQLLCEGMLLGIAGAALGLMIAPQALRLLITWMKGRASHDSVFKPTMDWHVFAFTVAAMLAGSVIFSLAPAIQFWNPRLADALKLQTNTNAGGSMRFRRTCVALQIGFSLLLFVGAGMFVRTVHNLRDVDPGFATDHLLTFDVSPELAGYPGEAVAPVEQRLLESIGRLPGIRSVGATNDRDLADDERVGDVYVTGDEGKSGIASVDVELPWVSTHYLQTLEVPLLAGRYFDASDTPTSQRVAIVNESFARHYFSSPQAALGHHVGRPSRPQTTDATIVGVVGDVKHDSVRSSSIAECYTLFQQAEKPTGLTFDARSWQAPDAAVSSIRAAVANIDAKLIVNNVLTMREQIDDNIAPERTIALLATVFGVLAALLAGIGLYGILAYATAQRTREIGIRMALGAQRRSVVGLILRETLILAGCAIAVALPIALLATRAIRGQLFGVSFIEPGVYAAGILMICFVAALAGCLPARRAASIDPARALRTE
ncbi:MAG TPA: ABC transporter permease [Acidobacteriaceae bacterium]|nr:ABC transporter permease [Acidobacteriaceae bacterium]